MEAFNAAYNVGAAAGSNADDDGEEERDEVVRSSNEGNDGARLNPVLRYKPPTKSPEGNNFDAVETYDDETMGWAEEEDAEPLGLSDEDDGGGNTSDLVTQALTEAASLATAAPPWNPSVSVVRKVLDAVESAPSTQGEHSNGISSPYTHLAPTHTSPPHTPHPPPHTQAPL